MLMRSHGSDVTYRMAEWGTESDIPLPGSGFVPWSGEPVTPDSVFGLAAAMQAVRQPSVLTASLDLGVYRGKGADKERVDDSAQAKLFASPTIDVTPFDWLSDTEAALNGYGNAFAEKIRSSRGQIVALEPIHPAFMQVRVENGSKVFDVFDPYNPKRDRRGLTSRTILHLRGFSIGPGFAAPSPIQVARNPLGVAVALERFVGDYFMNDATPGGALMTDQRMTDEEAQAKAALWKTQYGQRGARNKVAVLTGGLKFESFPISLADAQFIESRNFSIEEIARIFNWPAWALDATEENETSMTNEDRSLQMMTFYLYPRLRRLESALASDPDLFGGTDLYPQFQLRDFVRVDAKSQAEVEHKRVQAGVWLRDEVRADHDMPPLPGGAGQVVPATPVGATAQTAPETGGDQNE